MAIPLGLGPRDPGFESRIPDFMIKESIYFLNNNNYRIDVSKEEIEERIKIYLSIEEFDYVINNKYLLTHEIVEVNEIIKKYGRIIFPQCQKRGSWSLRKITEFHYLAMRYELLQAKYDGNIEHLRYRSYKVPSRFINNKIESIFKELKIDHAPMVFNG